METMDALFAEIMGELAEWRQKAGVAPAAAGLAPHLAAVMEAVAADNRQGLAGAVAAVQGSKAAVPRLVTQNPEGRKKRKGKKRPVKKAAGARQRAASAARQSVAGNADEKLSQIDEAPPSTRSTKSKKGTSSASTRSTRSRRGVAAQESEEPTQDENDVPASTRSTRSRRAIAIDVPSSTRSSRSKRSNRSTRSARTRNSIAVSPTIQKSKKKNTALKRVALRDLTNTPTRTTDSNLPSPLMTKRSKRLAKRNQVQENYTTPTTTKRATRATKKAVEHSDATESSRRTRSQRSQAAQEPAALSGMSDLGDVETPVQRAKAPDSQQMPEEEDTAEESAAPAEETPFVEADKEDMESSDRDSDEDFQPEDVTMEATDEDVTVEVHSKTPDVPMAEPAKSPAVEKKPVTTPKQVLAIAMSGASPEEKARELGKIAAKSPGGKFKVDESGNVTDKGLERLMMLAGGPSKATPTTVAASTSTHGLNMKSIFNDQLSTKSLGLAKKSALNDQLSTKSLGVTTKSIFSDQNLSKSLGQSKKSILKRPPLLASSRQTVAKTPGVDMPRVRAAELPSAASQTYGDIAASLFLKSGPAATPTTVGKEPAPLFAKSIFSAPMPPLAPSTASKKISFAPLAALKATTDGTLPQKRDAGSIGALNTPVGMLKRPRTAGTSAMEAKSSLRERIESVRKSKGALQSGGFPATPSVQTPSNLALNYAPTFDPVKSPTSRAQSSVRFTKLQGLGDFKVKDSGSAKEASNRKSSDGKTPASSKNVKTPLSEIGSRVSKVTTSTPGTRDKDVETAISLSNPVGNEAPHHTSQVSKSPAQPTPPAPSAPPAAVNADEVIDITGDEPHAPKPASASASAGPSASKSSASEVINVDAQDTSVLSNLMTSVKSFMPATIFGYNDGDVSPAEETEEMRTARLAEEARIDDERREMEMIARKEAQRMQRKVEADEKQKRAEANRKARALAELKKEEERKRKEAERKRKLRADNDARKAKKAEDDQKREARRKRVLEHQQRVRELEEKRRAELEAKEQERRRQAAAGRRPVAAAGASSSSAMPPPAGRGPKTPGASRGLFLGEKKKAEEITSYEMSAEKRFNPDDSDDENSGKPIPKWARNANVMKVHCEQTEDPDKVFKHVTTVDLEQVFASTNIPKKRYRTRHSSGQWTRDRLTAKEEMEYKRNAGFI